MNEIKVINTIKDIREQVKSWKQDGLSVGFVPTMGFLHEGHKSLIDRAVAENDRVVVSVFVNPMQFSPSEDLATYPRDLNADQALCKAAQANVIFHPTPEEMYPEGFCSFVDMDAVTKELCGKSRSSHFRGVCTVVAKLFNIVMPTKAYFGQKDAQQLAVIRRMVIDLSMDIEIVACPISREADGLARSSRNTYLSPSERQAALVLSRAIFLSEQLVKAGERSAPTLIAAMRDVISAEPLAKIDYIEVMDADCIKRTEELNGNVLVAIAVFIGTTRLIDNFTITL